MRDQKHGKKAGLLRIATGSEFIFELRQTRVIDDAEIKRFVQRFAGNVFTDRMVSG
jgi:hypothetical protein